MSASDSQEDLEVEAAPTEVGMEVDLEMGLTPAADAPAADKPAADKPAAGGPASAPVDGSGAAARASNDPASAPAVYGQNAANRTTSDDLADIVQRLIAPIQILPETIELPWVPWAGLFERLMARTNRKKVVGESYRISMAQVQKAYLDQLKIQLAQDVADMVKNKEPPRVGGRWSEDLHRYVRAVQDLDVMDRWAERWPRDPFLITGERVFDRAVLRDVTSTLDDATLRQIQAPAKRAKKIAKPSDGVYRPAVRSKEDYRVQLTLARVVEALISVALGLIPVWLLLLQDSFVLSLVIVSVSTAVFGGLVQYWMFDDKEAIASTGAYASLLVIFAGTTWG